MTAAFHYMIDFQKFRYLSIYALLLTPCIELFNLRMISKKVYPIPIVM